MFNPLTLLLRPRDTRMHSPEEIERVQNSVTKELKEKMTEIHKSAKEFEETAKEFLDDKEKFEGNRRGKY